jgi:hypothetical protein
MPGVNPLLGNAPASAGGNPLLSSAPAAAPSSGGGGFLSDLTHPLRTAEHVKNDVTGAAHTAVHAVDDTITKGADVAASVGTGIYKLGKDALDPKDSQEAPFWTVKGWEQLADPKTYESDPLGKDVGAMAKQTATSVVHPGRDPIQTAITGLMLLSGGTTMLAKMGYASDALRASHIASTGQLVLDDSPAADAARAAGDDVTPLTKAQKMQLVVKTLNPRNKVPMPERTLEVPKLVAPSPVDAAEGSASAASDAVKGSVAEGPAKLVKTPIHLTASHVPLIRAVQELHDNILQHSLDSGGKIGTKIADLRTRGALDEAATRTADIRAVTGQRLFTASKHLDDGIKTPQAELALFLRSANVSPAEAADFWKSEGNLKDAAAAQAIHDKGLLEIGEDGKMRVNAEKFPKLAATDQAVKSAQTIREGVISKYKLMTKQGQATRINLVPETMRSEVARNAETGAREGQGYTSLKTSLARPSSTKFSRAAARIIPKAKRLSMGKEATGTGIAGGFIPASTTQAVARSLHDALRFVNSDELRQMTAKLGSDVKRTGDDTLIRDPEEHGSTTIPTHIKELLGVNKSTLSKADEEAAHGALKNLIHSALPHLENPEEDDKLGIGTRAPAGYKFVRRGQLPDSLTSSTAARRGIERAADTVNSAVTAATVYFRLGHLPTRLLTNLSTNLTQGSLAPDEIGKTFKLARALSDEQKQELVAATGTSGYQALPHEGEGVVSKIAASGARRWARRVDAPFRLNSILFEMRQIGIDTPEAVESALKQLRDPSRAGQSGADIAKLDGAVRRANRAAIMYNGISAKEKQYVSRYMWFYPWTKGATRFALHTIAEHPGKSVAGYAVGKQGSALRSKDLGAVPPYELGLTPFGGGSNPLTSTFSSFTPYDTIGQVGQILQHPLNTDTGLLGQLNPVYNALATLVQGKGIGKAASNAFEPTPEFQSVNAALHPPRPGQMFGDTPTGIHDDRLAAVASALLRAIGGAGVPRPTNTAELHKAAADAAAKKREITVYG